jgi:mRNA-degrading endonuclease toxin of MazEF toxin-antitoxin module
MSPDNPVGLLRYGQIVLTPAEDGRGNTKTRPVVIVSPTAGIAEGKPILAVFISTQVVHPMPPEHVALPWSNPRHPRTD